MAQPVLNATELDFDQIKSNLKAYFLRQESPIKDWNYDGSGLNMLLDVLAYNTHYNAVLAHLNLNESFIDTAQRRSSVISLAKLLGYVPTSIGAASVNVTATFTTSGTIAFTDTLIIPSGAKFNGTSPAGSFTFITPYSITANVKTGSNCFIADLSLIQGVTRSQTYQVDNALANQRFMIDDDSADISTLKVSVFPNQNTTNPIPYFPISTYIGNSGKDDISNVSGFSQIYYLSLNSSGKYDVTFGDGVLGRTLNNLSVVQLTYLSTLGPVANNVSQFTYADETLETSDGAIITDTTVTALTYSSGGSDRESTESIRINAPPSMIAQNRAVTALDYIAILQKQNPEIVSSIVWGGEDEVAYDPINAARFAGKVFISYTTKEGQPLNSIDVIARLIPFKVMSVTPIYYAPDIVNIVLKIDAKFNPNQTSRGSTDIAVAIGKIVDAYKSSSIKRFTDVFRHSNLLRLIDTSDPSILNSDMQVSFHKNYFLNKLTGAADVTLYGTQALPNGLVTTFGNALYGTMNQTTPMVTSSAFVLSSVLNSPQTAIIVFGTYSNASTTVTLSSSPGTSTAASNNITNPYLVVGSALSSGTNTGGFTTSRAAIITSINNLGSNSILTLNIGSTLVSLSAAALTITPPGGTFYLKDGPDPESTTTRKLFMSTYSTNRIASDPKYVSTGSDIHIGTVYPLTGKVELYTYITGQVSGVSTLSAAGYSLIDTFSGGTSTANDKDWYTNQFTSCSLAIVAGSGVGLSAVITSNSANQLNWTTPPILLDATSRYTIIRSVIDTSNTSSNIQIYSRPASNDVAPSRHQILSISSAVITATEDTFAQAGVTGAKVYTTFARDP